MSTNLATILLLAGSIAVAQGRVTFTHSEVLQHSDLDALQQATFACTNGCRVYADSASADVFISDGVKDVSSFALMNADVFNAKGTELAPSASYRLVFRSAAASAPHFVFYSVDKKAAYLDTPVRVLGDAVGAMIDAYGGGKMTLLVSNLESAPFITFNSQYPVGFPKIYATGYDAVAESACKPVYEPRSAASMANSYLYLASPIITIDKGTPASKSAALAALSAQSSPAAPNAIKLVKASRADRVPYADSKLAVPSSEVFISPGFVGCSYNSGQAYFTGRDQVREAFKVTAKSLDLDATYSSNAAARITINGEQIDLVGASTKRRFESTAGSFEVAIDWARTVPAANFALQLDYGLPKGN